MSRVEEQPELLVDAPVGKQDLESAEVEGVVRVVVQNAHEGQRWTDAPVAGFVEELNSAPASRWPKSASRTTRSIPNCEIR